MTVGGKVAGFCGMGLRGRMAYLVRAGVLPEFRGRGLQRRMIRARVAEARRLGCILVETYVFNRNKHSINNLAAEGFYIVSAGPKWMVLHKAI